MREALPHLAMILAVTFWSSSSTAIKFILPVIPVFEAVSFRFVIAAALLWLVVLAARQLRYLKAVGWQPYFAGMIDPGVIAIMAYVGLTMTTAVHAVVIFSTMPLLASVIGRVFLKEPLTLPVFGGALLGLGGTVLLLSSSLVTSNASLIGDALLIGAVILVCFAQLVLRRVARDRGRPIVITALMISGAATIGLIALGIFGTTRPLAWIEFANTDIWLVFLYSATVISAAAFFLYNFALRHMHMGRVSLYSVLQAPLGVSLAAAVLGESVSDGEMAGIALVITGVALPALHRAIQLRRAAS
jgi:drug/metabolite transporter (DMT)-like permease